MFRTSNLVALALGVLTFSTTLTRADDVSVDLDKTKLLTVSVAPSTVVVGNPSIADVTINGNQIFLQGIGYGTTNVIMLDASGSQIAYLDVTVKQAMKQTAVVFSNGKRQTLSCTPNCENTLTIGDDAGVFSKVQGDVGSKRGLANGISVQATAGSQAVATGQAAEGTQPQAGTNGTP